MPTPQPLHPDVSTITTSFRGARNVHQYSAVHRSYNHLGYGPTVETDQYIQADGNAPRRLQSNVRHPVSWANFKNSVLASNRRGRFPTRNRSGAISGNVVDKDGFALRRQVRLYDRASGEFIAQTISLADGAYRFDGLNLDRRYTVVAVDYTDTYNAVVADNARPE
ncbi:MAG: hypothetical protein AAFY29_10945 [Pseudomonadota bacterium]